MAIAGFIAACSPSTTNTVSTPTEEEEAPPLEGLPMQSLALGTALAESNEGWSTVAAVYSDSYATKNPNTSEGEGVLISRVSEDGQMNTLNLGITHQDLDLEFEFLLPSEGQAQLLLQGQYPVNLNDSWGASSDYIGAVQGTEVKDMNTCKAPGLWQQFSASFHAPRFDESGNLTQKATIEDVMINGKTVHHTLELESDSPVATGPLQMLASDQVAVRNVEYKAYGLDSLRLENIRYDLFYGDWDKLPDFSQLEVAKSGTADFLDVKVAGQPDKYALKFYGDLYVPTDGEYFIQSMIDDGGELFIDGALVLHNDGEPNFGVEQTLTTLTAGKHDFEMTFFQDHWGTALVVVYEGPGIAKQTLPSDPGVKKWIFRKDNRSLAVVDDLQEPELLRGFANFKEKKLTHVISVGTPQGVHFLYDLDQTSLLKVWQGNFADVAKMWLGRGESQLMEPMNAAIELNQGLSVAPKGKSWPTTAPDGYKNKGYDIQDNGLPIFKYLIGNDQFTDISEPAEDRIGAVRTISSSNGSAYRCKLAEANNIQALSQEGHYNIDGQYYLIVLDAGAVELLDDNTLVADFANGKVQYKVIW